MKTALRPKKYNNQTGCYKIDIFVNGVYACSTDQSKSCKQAVEKYLKRFKDTAGKVTAFYFRP